MNFVNRMGQMMAERGDLKRMNIVERTELWYRLERIGQPPAPLKSKTIPPPQPTNKEVLDRMHQQLVRANDLEVRLNTHIDKAKKRRESRY